MVIMYLLSHDLCLDLSELMVNLHRIAQLLWLLVSLQRSLDGGIIVSFSVYLVSSLLCFIYSSHGSVALKKRINLELVWAIPQYECWLLYMVPCSIKTLIDTSLRSHCSHSVSHDVPACSTNKSINFH